jgi:hypothetical protein
MNQEKRDYGVWLVAIWISLVAAGIDIRCAGRRLSDDIRDLTRVIEAAGKCPP